MSATEQPDAVEGAPPSPAPSNKAESPAPAAPADSAPQADTDAPAEAEASAETKDTPAEEAKPESNGSKEKKETTAAPPSSKRTSSRTKQASPSKSTPAPAPKSSGGAGRPVKKARASTAGDEAGKKAGQGSGGDKNLKVGDIVLARLKGYPAWPARIADNDALNKKVLDSRNGRTSHLCVQFFPVGDYAWLHPRDIVPLSSSDISKYLAETHRTNGGLREAYQTAQDPTEWDEAQADIVKSRADDDAGEEEVDELEDEDEEAQTGGKRKKGSVREPSNKKAKKEKKEEAAPKSKSKAAAKPKAAGNKKAEPKPAVENQAPADEEGGPHSPEDVKVKNWRHNLQRAFLGKTIPESEEMSTYDDLFKSIEEYDSMTIEALQYSKIGKVMKKIAAMTTIPRNDELKITDRAQKLMNDWQIIIEQNPSGESGANGESKNAKNGDSKMEVEA